MDNKKNQSDSIVGALAAALFGIFLWIVGVVFSLIFGHRIEKCKEKEKAIKQQIEEKQKESNYIMDRLGNLELDVMESFEDFANVLEQLKERPDLNKRIFGKKTLPSIDAKEFRALSSSALAIKLAVKNAADGVVGCIATSGGVGIALTVLEAASAGTGGSTGAALLSAITSGSAAQLSASLLSPLLGIGLLVGGGISFVKGFKLSSDALKVKKEVNELGKKADLIMRNLTIIDEFSTQYYNLMKELKSDYDINFLPVKCAVEEGRTKNLSKDELIKLENSIILADLLCKMCKVQFVKQATTEDGVNSVNDKEIKNTMLTVRAMKEKLSIA